jgi:hypothetical protein
LFVELSGSLKGGLSSLLKEVIPKKTVKVEEESTIKSMIWPIPLDYTCTEKNESIKKTNHRK